MIQDITKCDGTNERQQKLSIAAGVEKLSRCPLRNKCKRFLAVSSPYQYRFIGIPYNKKTKKCKFFMVKEKR